MAKKNNVAEEKLPVSISHNVKGVITSFMFGKTQKDKNEKYRISLKVSKEELEKLREKAAPFFAETDKKWLPDWYTKDDAEYINFKSIYPVQCGVRDEHNNVTPYSMDDVLEKYGFVSGSVAMVSVTIKEDAIYPAAVLIVKLETKTISDYFEGEDFDFASMAEDNPFEDANT